jgi:hypothetical protein
MANNGADRASSEAAQPLPPAVTQWTVKTGNDRGAALAPPFRTALTRRTEVTEGTEVAVEVPTAVESPPAASVTAAPTEVSPPILPNTDERLPWLIPEEGEAAPTMFEGSISLTPEVAQPSAEAKGEFPIDAFIIPEETKRVPTGLAPAEVEAVIHQTEHPPHDVAHDLADRFEKLSRRLRAEDMNSLLNSLALGDGFDAQLAIFLKSHFSSPDA